MLLVVTSLYDFFPLFTGTNWTLFSSPSRDEKKNHTVKWLLKACIICPFILYNEETYIINAFSSHFTIWFFFHLFTTIEHYLAILVDKLSENHLKISLTMIQCLSWLMKHVIQMLIAHCSPPQKAQHHSSSNIPGIFGIIYNLFYSFTNGAFTCLIKTKLNEISFKWQ